MTGLRRDRGFIKQRCNLKAPRVKPEIGQLLDLHRTTTNLKAFGPYLLKI